MTRRNTLQRGGFSSCFLLCARLRRHAVLLLERLDEPVAPRILVGQHHEDHPQRAAAAVRRGGLIRRHGGERALQKLLGRLAPLLLREHAHGPGLKGEVGGARQALSEGLGDLAHVAGGGAAGVREDDHRLVENEVERHGDRQASHKTKRGVSSFTARAEVRGRLRISELAAEYGWWS